jgi:hypothetical protein
MLIFSSEIGLQLSLVHFLGLFVKQYRYTLEQVYEFMSLLESIIVKILFLEYAHASTTRGARPVWYRQLSSHEWSVKSAASFYSTNMFSRLMWVSGTFLKTPFIYSLFPSLLPFSLVNVTELY